MRWVLSLVAMGAVACASASSPEKSFVIATSAKSASPPEKGVVASGAAGRAVLLEGAVVPAPWGIVAKLDPTARAKLVDVSKLLSALEAESEGRLPVYVGIGEGGSTEGEEALRTTLAEAGCRVQTVAGDLVTGLLDPRRVGDVARLSWVKSITPAGKVELRSE